MFRAAGLFVWMLLPASLLAADAPAKWSEAKTDEQGIRTHEVQSAQQDGTTQVRVLLPDKLDDKKRYPVIYVLPVEAARGSQYGDGLLEVKKHDLHNKHQAVFVYPTFSALPWYADHPTNPKSRQENYFLEVVVPGVEKLYPVRNEASGRLLLGFSKSGWGAFTLLLRHPKLFAKAAAWDSPMMMDQSGRFGSGPIFGTQENFEHYQVTKLLERRAGELAKEKRLILLGYGGFRKDHERVHELMTKLKIEHDYRDGPTRKHDWHSGWVAEAVELLLK